MKSKRKQFQRTVTALVDADPTFVSLVSAGANGSPFNVVKQENPTMGVKIKKRTAPTDAAQNAKGATAVRKNANNRVAKGKEALAEAHVSNRAITKFFYSKEEFETEAEVRAHIEKSDFEGGFDVTEDDDQFIVTATDVDAARVAKSAVVETGDDGVTAEVSILKDAAEGDESEEDEDDAEEEDEDEEDDEEEEGEADDDEGEEDEPAPVAKNAPKKPAAKKTETPAPAAPVKSKKALFLEEAAAEAAAEEEEPVEVALQKFDFWEVYDSASSDFLTLLKNGCEDGLAPGFDDVMWTFGQSIRKTLAGDDDAEGPLKKNAEDFCNVVLGMHNLFASIVNADMGVIEKADKDRAAGLTKWAKSFGKELVAKAERGTTNVVNVTKAEGGISEAALQAAVAAAVAPIAEQMSTVTKAVDKMGNRRQVSKGIDPADATTSEGSKKPAATQKKEADPAAVAAAERISKSVFAAR